MAPIYGAMTHGLFMTGSFLSSKQKKRDYDSAKHVSHFEGGTLLSFYIEPVGLPHEKSSSFISSSISSEGLRVKVKCKYNS